MSRRVYAEIPSHKKYDADCSSHGGIAKRLADYTESKLAMAKTDKERQGFEVLAPELAEMASKARDLRHTLWEAPE